MAPGFDDGLVYVSSVAETFSEVYPVGGVGTMYALDAKTGKTVWEFATIPKGLWGDPDSNAGGGAWYPPSFDDAGAVYFGTADPTPVPGAPGKFLVVDQEEGLAAGFSKAVAPETGAPLTMLGFQYGLPGEWGQMIVVVGVLLFAISTAIAWSYYGDRCAHYLFGPKAVLPYKIAFIFMHFLGAVAPLALLALKPGFDRLKHRFDFERYGGAPLLGIEE